MRNVRWLKPALLCLCMFFVPVLMGCGREEKKALEAPENLEAVNSEEMTIGVASGYIFDDVAVKAFPKATIRYYDSREDAYRALSYGEVNCIVDDDGVVRAIMRSVDTMEILDGYAAPSDYGFVFPKNAEGEKLAGEFNEYLAKVKADGTLQELDDKWFGKETDNKQSKDLSELAAPNGVLTMAFESPTVPFTYLSAKEPTGYEIDLAIGFCEAYGYGLEAEAVDFIEVLNGVADASYDFGASGITITEERKERLIFSDPEYNGGICVCVNSGAKKVSGKSGIGDLKRDVEKSFFEEGRGKLFLSGIGTTFLIVLLAMMIGTPVGIIWYILSKRAVLIVQWIVKFLMFLLRYTPPVIVIMMIYYAYYAGLSLGSFLAATIGFMLCFSEAVYRQIATFAAPCRDGQLETDFRLEAIDADVFFVRLFRDKGTEIEVDYKERMIELIRMTSVVGFVAANDMTHVLEVIRMESLELWIPLIATAVAYIVLTVVMCKLLDVFATKCFTLCEMQVWCKVMDE